MRLDLQIIAKLIEPNSKILDVGCADGTLLEYLGHQKNVRCRGIEINTKLVSKALKKGLSVVHGDADNDLKHYPANSFDYVILSQTLQATKAPDLVLKELQRIAKHVIVSVPNFGYIENRLHLSLKGRMPVTRTISYQWFDTPNIHFCTITDFILLCRSLNYAIEKQYFINDALPLFKCFRLPIFANLIAKNGIFLLKRGITVDVQEKSFIKSKKAVAAI